MNAQLIALYHRCRRDKPFMLVGSDAKCSLNAARTILAFRELESRGVVRLRAEPEHENYFDVYGEPDNEKQRDNIVEQIERYGCNWCVAEWLNGDEWEQADSIGMCIHPDPLSPFENCYIVQLMQSAVDAWNAHVEEMAAAI